jgi:hypothetical protein
MTEGRTGRLLAACLHQAIADRLPERLEFYETWLRSEGLRDGSIGLAPITAVLGFLRTEGEAYNPTVTRAGELAADWSIASLGSVRRRAIGWLPRPLRTRAALQMAAGVVRDLHLAGRTFTRLRRNQARVEIRSSLFCSVREAPLSPLCGFYVALATETLKRFGIPASGRVENCQAMAGPPCVILLELHDATAVAAPAIAA